MGLELCPRCHTMHYSTDACRATKSTGATEGRGGTPNHRPGLLQAIADPSKIRRDQSAGESPAPDGKTVLKPVPVDTKRNKDRHKPGYMKNYMRKRRAKISGVNTPSRVVSDAAS